MDFEELFKQMTKRKQTAVRRAKLLDLLNKINSGEVSSEMVPLDKLYSLYSKNRKEYQSPLDRSTYNYGYMTDSEVII